MGYMTRFTGKLLFTSELTAKQLNKLHKMYGEDCRKHPEWGGDRYLTYVDLRTTDELDGIEWDDNSESTRDLDQVVNVIIREMRKESPSFGLTGTLFAQGEESNDRWQLVIGEDGFAKRVELKVFTSADKIQCPHCQHEFYPK